jgi:hypothetical protein
MNNDLAKDRLITHGVTNYLAAAYQGQFSALNVLAQFEHPTFEEKGLVLVQRNLSKVHQWTAQLFEDECLLSATWTAPETFEAQDAISMLDNLKAPLYEAASSASRILALNAVPEFAELVLLLALHARHVYSRDTYIRGFIDYGNKFSLPEMIRRYEVFIPELSAEVQRNQQLIAALRRCQGDRSSLPQEFFPLLFQSSVALPAFFRSHIHDINQLLSQYRGGLSWATAEFSQAEAELWGRAGIGVAAAGYFRAFGMGPEEAGKWREAGVFEAGGAVDWKRAGFGPEGAAEWINERIPPPLAFLWNRAGYTPEETRTFLEKGVSQPPPKEAKPAAQPGREKKGGEGKPPPKKMSYPKRI